MSLTADQMLDEARAHLDRLAPAPSAGSMWAGAVFVDIRPLSERARDGEMPGAIVVGRNVLEWRLDPASPYRLPEADDPQRQLVIFCSDGYQSSLAARAAQQLGWNLATDLEGGFRAWVAAGLPIQPCAGPTPEESGAEPIRR
jgi:rhodanese-related sulfurtransferase